MSRHTKKINKLQRDILELKVRREILKLKDKLDSSSEEKDCLKSKRYVLGKKSI